MRCRVKIAAGSPSKLLAPRARIAGALAYGEDVPEAEVHLLDAGHFALDEAAPEIAASSGASSR